MSKKFVIVGPTPPPIGGVSIHVSRLHSLLNRLGLPSVVVSTTSKTSAGGIVGIGHSKILGVFSCRDLYRDSLVVVNSSELHGVLVSVFCKFSGATVVQYFHNARMLERVSKSWFGHLLLKYFLSSLDEVFVVNERIKGLVSSVINQSKPVYVVNPFLPPDSSEFVSVNSLNFKEDVFYVGWCGLGFGPRAEIYGLNFFIEVVERMRALGRNVVPVLAFGDYLELDESIFNELNLAFQENFIVVPSHIPFVSVLPYLNAFIRPTLSDGDAVSIREALALSVPVLATDVVDRPKGVTVFPLGGIGECLEFFDKIFSNKKNSERKLFRGLSNPGVMDFVGQRISPSFLRSIIEGAK